MCPYLAGILRIIQTASTKLIESLCKGDFEQKNSTVIRDDE